MTAAWRHTWILNGPENVHIGPFIPRRLPRPHWRAPSRVTTHMVGAWTSREIAEVVGLWG
jgi:hypothetical protein